jgi:hypothetical protein
MSDSRWERWAPVAGIVFVVLFVAGTSLNNLPATDEHTTAIANYYNDKGNRAQIIIGSYLLVLAGVFFFWFLASLRVKLLAAEGAPGRLTSIVFGSGLVFAALLMAAAGALMTVAADVTFGGDEFIDADSARFLPQLAYPLLLIGGMFAAIAMIDAASVLIVKTGVLPRWVGWFGFAVAVVLLFGALFLPIVALLLWVFFVSVALLRAPAKEVARPAA